MALVDDKDVATYEKRRYGGPDQKLVDRREQAMVLLRGDEIPFSIDGTRYAGRVNGDAMHGANSAWTATRIQPKPR